MKKLLFAVLTASLLGCAHKASYEDPTYTLQRNLRDRNQRYDDTQKRQTLRRQARDQRYQAWFNSVME